MPVVGLVVEALLAGLFTLVGGLLHLSHVDGRLTSPDGWTGWVVTGVGLAVMPLPVAIVAFVATRVGPSASFEVPVEVCLHAWLGASLVGLLVILVRL